MTLTKFIRTSVAALGALAAATQAQAADIYSGGGMKEPPMYAPTPIWTGFYLGLHMGAAWSSLELNKMRFDDQYMGHSGYEPAWLGGDKLNSTNAFGGGQFGYNFQTCGGCSFVYGIEVDLGGIALNNRDLTRGHTSYTSGGSTVVGTPVELYGKDDGGFAGDVTGRLGYAWGSALVYAKGGFAFFDAGNLKLRESIFTTGTGMCGYAGWCDFNNNNNSEWLTGWTVGAGVEWKVSPAWSIKVEYMHYDFSTNNLNCCNDYYYTNYSSSSYTYNNWHNNNDILVDTVKLGFNYYFNPVSAPMPLK
ncbi:MAG: porin family protein [Rhodomicrobium sp.]